MAYKEDMKFQNIGLYGTCVEIANNSFILYRL